MSWLSERTIRYRYKMADDSVRIVELPANFDPATTYTFDDNEVGSYAGFEPEEIRQTNVVEFEQNGRKAVRVRDAGGGVRHISKTKLHYMKTGRIENQYTKEFQDHLVKTKQEHMLRTEHSRKRAKVSTASAKDVLKNLPDGEYLSDGKNVIPAPAGIADKGK